MHTDKKISFTIPTTPFSNRIAVIKAIRCLTGLGLKEAKDASEMLGTNQSYILNASYFAHMAEPDRGIEEQCRILRNEGVIVGEPIHRLIEELRKLGSQALLQGEDEFANEILQIVLAEKLRRGT